MALSISAEVATYLAGVLTLIASFVVLRLYRSRIVRLMSEGAANEFAPTRVVRMRTALLGARATVEDATVRDFVRTRPRFAVATEMAAAGVAAGVLTAGTEAAWGDSTVPRAAMTWLIYFWPAFLGAALVAPRGWPDLKWPLLCYLTLVLTMSVRALLVNKGLSWWMLAELWFIFAGTPTLLALVTLARPIRTVGPLLFVCCVGCLFGALASSSYVVTHWTTPFFFRASWMLERLGISLLLLPLIVAGFAFLIFGVFGLVALVGVRWLYVKKWQSDLSLAVDALWLICSAVWVFNLYRDLGVSAVFIGFGAFAAHRLVVMTLWRWSRQQYRPPSPRAPRLLFLRVFAQSRRRERLLHAVIQRWRFVGSVQMIAGPDLATTSVEPHELLEFLFGRLRAAFLRGPGDLEGALAALDERPDPDGRYRITELFCSGGFWRQAVRRLLVDTDVVLVDLRGLNATSQGIRFELEQSRSLVPPDRTLLLLDTATDLGLLANAFGVPRFDPTARAPAAGALPRALWVSGAVGLDAATITERMAAMAFGFPVGANAPDALADLSTVVPGRA